MAKAPGLAPAVSSRRALQRGHKSLCPLPCRPLRPRRLSLLLSHHPPSAGDTPFRLHPHCPRTRPANQSRSCEASLRSSTRVARSTSTEKAGMPLRLSEAPRKPRRWMPEQHMPTARMIVTILNLRGGRRDRTTTRQTCGTMLLPEGLYGSLPHLRRLLPRILPFKKEPHCSAHVLIRPRYLTHECYLPGQSSCISFATRPPANIYPETLGIPLQLRCICVRCTLRIYEFPG